MNDFDDLFSMSSRVIEDNPFPDPFMTIRSGSPDPWATFNQTSDIASHDASPQAPIEEHKIQDPFTESKTMYQLQNIAEQNPEDCASFRVQHLQGGVGHRRRVSTSIPGADREPLAYADTRRPGTSSTQEITSLGPMMIASTLTAHPLIR